MLDMDIYCHIELRDPEPIRDLVCRPAAEKKPQLAVGSLEWQRATRPQPFVAHYPLLPSPRGGLHRALAAFRADSARSSAVIPFALAAPPFTPPRRPRATAAGFFNGTSGGGGSWPVARWTTAKAVSLASGS